MEPNKGPQTPATTGWDRPEAAPVAQPAEKAPAIQVMAGFFGVRVVLLPGIPLNLKQKDIKRQTKHHQHRI